MIHFKIFQKPSITFLLTFIAAIIAVSNLSAQNFVKITDTNNPIVTDALSGNYIGCSWIDIDNDRKLDLFVSRKAIYKNLGGGNFMKLDDAFKIKHRLKLKFSFYKIPSLWTDVASTSNVLIVSTCFL